jgi:hypothetical protein
MIVFFVIVLVVLFLALLYTFWLAMNLGDGYSFVDIDVAWRTHRSMTEMQHGKIADGTFADFLKMYGAVDDWELEEAYSESIFSKGDGLNTRIHASYIRFQGVYMRLDKESFREFYKWERELKRKHKEFFSVKEAFEVPWRKGVSGV